jgi:hypothetical protein
LPGRTRCGGRLTARLALGRAGLIRGIRGAAPRGGGRARAQNARVCFMEISMPQTPLRCLFALAGIAAALCSQAQTIKPPQAQAWIDVATFSGLGLPSGGMAGANPMAMMGAMMGGGAAANSFGQTQSGAAGRWVDVTLFTRANAQLDQAQQEVPAGFMSPALQLRAPSDGRAAPPDDDKVVEQPTERPQGRLLLYWGCGATVRAGQPKVLDMASASAADLASFFTARRARSTATLSVRSQVNSGSSRPKWP